MITRISLSLTIIFSAIGVAEGQDYSALRNFYDEFRKNKYEHSIGEKIDIKGSFTTFAIILTHIHKTIAGQTIYESWTEAD